MSTEDKQQQKASNPFNDYVFLNATPAERGSFTLATDKALAKLEKFQLPDPTFFILQWVQAIVASGAGQIDVTYSTNSFKSEFELFIQFDGPGYTRNEVDNLYDHVFLSGRDRQLDRLRELSLGWLSACSLPITSMAMQSNGRRRHRQLVAKQMEESCEGSPSQVESDDIRHQLKMQGKGHYPFREILLRRCNEVPCDLNFNGDLISSSSPAGVPWPNRPFHIGPTKGVLGATYGGSSTSHIAFVRHGVEFISRPEPSLQPPVIVRITDPTLSKNVSQTDVVRDDAYEDFLARLRVEMKKMGLQLTKKRIPGYQREALNRFIQSYLVSYIDVRVFDDPQRLQLMGPEFQDLVEFPLFRLAGKAYISLAELRQAYQSSGYLLYSMDQRALLTRWDGILLILEPEEVVVLNKYFSNLTALSYDEVKLLHIGGAAQTIADRDRPVAARTTEFIGKSTKKGTPKRRGRQVSIVVPDVYPTGQTTHCLKGATQGKSVPGIPLTLRLEAHTEALTNNDLAQLKGQLADSVVVLLESLCNKLKASDVSKSHSRLRYAELACEMILYLLAAENTQLSELKDDFNPIVLSAPLIGLEDGSMASLTDIQTYLGLEGRVYCGGAFVEGLESGALDPMPCAERLLERLIHPSSFVPTESVREFFETRPEFKFRLRKQTLIPGLGLDPAPAKTLQNFAKEAEAEAQELERIEKEYKLALENKIFIKPDEKRLQELEELSVAEEEFVPFDISGSESDAVSSTDQTQAVGQTPTRPLTVPLPSLDADLALLRQELGDFCVTPGAVHVERREEDYHIHLSLCWQKEPEQAIHWLQADNKVHKLYSPLALEGFIRLSQTCKIAPDEILTEATEQLVTKVIHQFKSEPASAHLRKRLRAWLLECCEFLPQWRKENPAAARELLQLALVPCRGGRYLSFRQLLRQAKRFGHTSCSDPSFHGGNWDPVCDVIELQRPWLEKLLEHLGFPRIVLWREVPREADFDLLLQNVWKDLTCVLNGHNPDLIGPDAIGKMPQDQSFWSKWRAGFLSWDEKTQKALVNPEHKLGKKLFLKYGAEPIWSSIFSCALFSTINRGLEEIEDRHEQAFLMGLLDNFD